LAAPAVLKGVIRILKVAPNRLISNGLELTHFEKKRSGINVDWRTLTPLI
jgi:hypothetical protein